MDITSIVEQVETAKKLYIKPNINDVNMLVEKGLLIGIIDAAAEYQTSYDIFKNWCRAYAKVILGKKHFLWRDANYFDRLERSLAARNKPQPKWLHVGH
jgi:hypothetical protein